MRLDRKRNELFDLPDESAMSGTLADTITDGQQAEEDGGDSELCDSGNLTESQTPSKFHLWTERDRYSYECDDENSTPSLLEP